MKTKATRLQNVHAHLKVNLGLLSVFCEQPSEQHVCGASPVQRENEIHPVKHKPRTP